MPAGLPSPQSGGTVEIDHLGDRVLVMIVDETRDLKRGQPPPSGCGGSRRTSRP
jgi:hypothetical protein